jgi:hypothetical protein
VHTAAAVDYVREHSHALSLSGEPYHSVDGDTLAQQAQLESRPARPVPPWPRPMRCWPANWTMPSARGAPAGSSRHAWQGHGLACSTTCAVAARHAIDVHGLERVAVIDFDVHHGNGTEDIFCPRSPGADGDFFQHPFYPFRATADRIAHRQRAGAGLFRRQCSAPAGDREMAAGACAHQPQMIFISAGFDAHREDDMGQMGLVEADYAWMTRQIMKIADQYAKGRIVSCLEWWLQPVRAAARGGPPEGAGRPGMKVRIFHRRF